MSTRRPHRPGVRGHRGCSGARSAGSPFPRARAQPGRGAGLRGVGVTRRPRGLAGMRGREGGTWPSNGQALRPMGISHGPRWPITARWEEPPPSAGGAVAHSGRGVRDGRRTRTAHGSPSLGECPGRAPGPLERGPLVSFKSCSSARVPEDPTLGLRNVWGQWHREQRAAPQLQRASRAQTGQRIALNFRPPIWVPPARQSSDQSPS
jgi:hypothetical protein